MPMLLSLAFVTFIIFLFLETYQQVDQPTGSKMEEMLITWQTSAPNGKELFGVIMQLSIEQGICGSYSTSPADVLSELEFTLSQKDGALQANTWDLTAQNHVDQLCNLVEAGISQDELQQIFNQLRSLMHTTLQVQPLPSSYPTHPAQSTHIRSHTHHYGAPAAHPTYSYRSEQSKPADISTLIPVALSSTLSSPLPPTNMAGQTHYGGYFGVGNSFLVPVND
ncbi:hypothetical protein EDC04DRAFT_2896576 [Pisolithus marmoratus]|nr:hypothetical protein EDC04DRAFT_2896576 [Pisolithus marmoratus]